MDFSFETLQKTLELVATGTQSIEKASTTLERVKKLFSKPQTANVQERDALIMALSQQIFDAQKANINLEAQIKTLEREIMTAKALDKEFRRYELWQTPAGVMVYRLKASRAQKEPLHYLCATCRQNNKKSILQGHAEAKQCHACDTWFRFQPSPGALSVGSRRDLSGF